jgi:hypothetical protein
VVVVVCKSQSIIAKTKRTVFQNEMHRKIFFHGAFFLRVGKIAKAVQHHCIAFAFLVL